MIYRFLFKNLFPYLRERESNITMLSLKLPKYLLSYLDEYRSSKCRAWYVLKSLQYVYENNINIYEHYEGVTNERIEVNDKGGTSKR